MARSPFHRYLGHQGAPILSRLLPDQEERLIHAVSRQDRQPELETFELGFAPAEPLLEELIVSAVFLELQQCLVDRFAIGAIRRKNDAVVFFTKDRSYGL